MQKRFTKVPNWFWDDKRLQRELGARERSVFLAIWRLTRGFGEEENTLSVAQICAMAGVKKSAYQEAMKKILELGLVSRYGRRRQASKFRVPLYPYWIKPKEEAPPAESRPEPEPARKPVPKAVDILFDFGMSREGDYTIGTMSVLLEDGRPAVMKEKFKGEKLIARWISEISETPEISS